MTTHRFCQSLRPGTARAISEEATKIEIRCSILYGSHIEDQIKRQTRHEMMSRIINGDVGIKAENIVVRAQVELLPIDHFCFYERHNVGALDINNFGVNAP